MRAKDRRGRDGEERAARYLSALGCEVLARNWRCALGEIDIIARDGREIVLVEVKTRRTDLYGHPFAAVDEQRTRRLWKAGRAWCSASGEPSSRPLRLDVIAITGEDPATADLEHFRDVR